LRMEIFGNWHEATCGFFCFQGIAA
jgi:hypothetical protein